jgi:transcriptional regulator with XRE-family HTH domain
MQEKTKKPHFDFDFFEDLTGDISLEPPKSVDDVGDRILRIRKEKDLSLDEISKMTGFDVEFLSKIENKELQPQLGTVIKLSKALDSAFGRLISGIGEKLYSITRKNERRTISRSTSKKGQKQIYTYKSLAPDVKGRHMRKSRCTKAKSSSSYWTAKSYWKSEKISLCSSRGTVLIIYRQPPITSRLKMEKQRYWR